jgi:hypothetical protein
LVQVRRRLCRTVDDEVPLLKDSRPRQVAFANGLQASVVPIVSATTGLDVSHSRRSIKKSKRFGLQRSGGLR